MKPKLQYQIGTVFLIISMVIAVPCWAGIEEATEAIKQGNCSEAQSILYKELNNPFLMKGLEPMLYLAFAGAVQVHGHCFDEGIKACDSWIRISSEPSKKSIAYDFRGDMWNKHGDYDKAIDDYTKSIELNPYEDNLSSMALLLASCPVDEYRDGEKAVEYAEKLIKIAEEEKAENFRVLATAYAEAGKFQEAIQAQEKAISLYKEKYPDGDTTKYEKQLASYKEGKPWRMEPPKIEEKQ